MSLSFTSRLKNLKTNVIGKRRTQARLAARAIRSACLNVELMEDRIHPAVLTPLAFFDGSNGSASYASVVTDGNGNLFGTTSLGGASNQGTVFEIAAGSGTITTLASFDGANGATPYAGMVVDGSGNLFGTTFLGGAFGYGTVFEIAAGSGTITTLASFDGTNGAAPEADMLMDGSGNLFGTTAGGGSDFDGTVFEIVAGSGTITTLASFDVNHGNQPLSNVVMDGNGNLFGVTHQGGDLNIGTVFEIVAGSGTITTLASFIGTNGSGPIGAVVMDGNGNLFGVTHLGGASDHGTAFEIVAGSGTITTLVSFDVTHGAYPTGGVLMDSNGNLFGTTTQGGTFGVGTVYEIVAGSGVITRLASFDNTNTSDSESPLTMDSSGNLFGTTLYGGRFNKGAVFEVSGLGNSPPTVTATTGTVIANEGSTATNTGSFNDPQGNNTVTLSADIGMVTQNNATGDWNWSLPGTDGPASPITVTITATDNQNSTATVTFTYSVINVAPTATLQTNSGIIYGQSANAKLANPTDPSTADTTAGFHYAFSLDTDTTGLATYASGGTSNTVQFGTIAVGTHTVFARIFDKNSGSTSYSLPLTVKAGQGSTFTVYKTTDDGSVGTLRWAVGQANSSPGADTINFDSTVFSTPQTITLTSGQLTLTDAATTTIVGLGANQVSISGNSASRVFNVASGAGVILDHLTLVNGKELIGGAILTLGSLTVTNSTFSGNTATGVGVGNIANGYGGGIASRFGTLTVVNSTFSGNSAPNSVGGGIASFPGSTLFVSASTFTGNSARIGGGLDTEQGTTGSVTNSTFTNNSASDQGGGISNFLGTLTVNNSTISNNTAVNLSAGLNNNSGTLTITNSTITNNNARIGGGIGNFVSGTLTVTNSTVFGNTSLVGGGIDNEQSTATITSSTIYGNSASLVGGGISNYQGTLTLNNSIVAHSTGADIATVGTVNGSNNVIQDGSVVLAVTIKADPMLAPLADNGGPTQTMALLPGSPAFNNGKISLIPAGATTDQRGLARISGNGLDIGAYEVTNLLLVTNTLDNNSVGSLRWAVGQANATIGADTINFDSTVFSTPQTITLTSGQLTLTSAGITTIAGVGANLISISGNSASRMFKVNPGASVILDDLNLVNGSGDNGGAIQNLGILTVSNSTVSGNVASGYGGGIANLAGGVLMVTGSAISGNSAVNSVGGGIVNLSGSTLMVSNSTITGNNAKVGSGIDTEGSTATVTNTTISNNTASNQGGGISNYQGTLTVTNSTVSNNTGTSLSGGIGNTAGTLTVTNSTFSGNYGRVGGGIGNFSGSTLTVTNSTFIANTSVIGAGIDTEQSTATITNSTLAGNSASVLGGGISNYQGSLTVNNTIVAHSTGGDIANTSAVSVSGVHNLIQDGSGGLTGTITGDPMLAPLGNYGGATPTMPLLPGSPAINTGTATGAPSADQRGLGRVGATDIGAFESSGFTIVVTSGSGQSAIVSQAFSIPLVVTVTANNPIEPVAGGVVTFTPPAGGASAAIGGSPATIGAAGIASVSATANGSTGSYTVSATAGGIATPASFSLENLTATPAPKVIAFRVLYGNGKSYDLTTSSRFDVPWLITGVEIMFSEPVFGTSASLVRSNGTLPISGFSGNGTSTLRWTFLNAIATADVMSQLVATGADRIHDAAGSSLDGDGNGTGGDTYFREFRVLYGDFNGDGLVALADGVLIRNLIGSSNIFADLNGDGVVDTNDYNIARSRINARLT